MIRKEVDDVLGGEDAWKDVDATDTLFLAERFGIAEISNQRRQRQ